MAGISITGTATVPISALRPYPRNPRAGDIEAITESVRAHGVYRHLIVNSRDNTVLCGNHLLHAAHEAGLTEVPVSYVDVDDEEAARIVLVDNRASQLGGMDEGLLAGLLSDLPSLDGTLYAQTDLDDLLARVQQDAGAALNLDGIAGNERYSEQYGVIVLCANEGEQRAVYERLHAEGLTVKVVVT